MTNTRDAAIEVLSQELRTGMPPLQPYDMAVALVYLLERAGFEVVRVTNDWEVGK